MATDDKVVDVNPQPEPQLRYRFVGNHLTLNSHHIAYVLNIMGVHISSEMHNQMPRDIQEHFVAIKV